MPGSRDFLLLVLGAALATLGTPIAYAQATAPLLRDSFPIGDASGTLC